MLTEISVHVITCICDTSVPLYVHASPKISTIKYERFFTCLASHADTLRASSHFPPPRASFESITTDFRILELYFRP